MPTIRNRIIKPLRETAGAFDMPSILVGAVVVAILAAGVLAAVLGVIPYAQDSQVQQNLSALRTAEGTARVKNATFRDSAGLASLTYLPLHPRVAASASPAGDCYIGVGKSETGKVFYSTDKFNEARPYTPSTMTGCLTPAAKQKIVDDIGGWGPDTFAPIGTGAGTSASPGQAAIKDDPLRSGTAGVTLADVKVTGGAITVTVQNSTSSPVTASYAADVTCANTTTGVVTVETLTETFDLNGNIVAGQSLDACAAGTTPIAVSVHAPDLATTPVQYASVDNLAIWQIHYVYNVATPVVRGSVTSGDYCIDDKDLATANGSPVILNNCNGSDAQRWQWNGNGEIRQSVLAGKCLAVANPASTTPQNLVIGTCDGSAAQSFAAVRVDSTMVKIVHAPTGFCIDIPGGARIAGVQLATAPCSGAVSQSWKLPALASENLVPGSVPNAPVPTADGGPALSLPTPTSVTLVSYSGTDATVSWTPVTGASGYLIEATGTSTVYSALRVGTTSAVTSSATINNGTAGSGVIRLPAGADGTLTVKTLNGAGAPSPASAPVSYSTPNNAVITTTADFTFAKAVMVASNGHPSDLASTPRGTALSSPNGRFFVVFQSDNNFVVYDHNSAYATYASNTYQTATTRLTFQKDANLVAYSATNAAVKSTGTYTITKPSILTMQDDGNVVIYDASGTAKWAATQNTFLVKR